MYLFCDRHICAKREKNSRRKRGNALSRSRVQRRRVRELFFREHALPWQRQVFGRSIRRGILRLHSTTAVSERISRRQITRMSLFLIGHGYAEERCDMLLNATPGRRHFCVWYRSQLRLSFAAQLQRHVQHINFPFASSLRRNRDDIAAQCFPALPFIFNSRPARSIIALIF